MIRAYDEGYLDDAMKCLGEAMDYAANCCEIKMYSFLVLGRAMLNNLLWEFLNVYREYRVRSL